MQTVAKASERQALSLEEVFRILGINRTTGYQLARQDRLPVPVLRIGRRRLVSKRAVDAVLDRTHGDESGKAA